MAIGPASHNLFDDEWADRVNDSAGLTGGAGTPARLFRRSHDRQDFQHV
jgi:hypothetical protein